MNKRLILALLCLPIVVVVIILLPITHWTTVPWKSKRTSPTSVENRVAATVTATPIERPNQPGQPSLLGESILAGYADPNLPPPNDLMLLSRLMDNSLLLLKNAANRPLSANEDWAALLRGQNAAHERFLSDSNAALNSQGQLIDRWGTPLFFHALGGGRYEVRSAGPDGTLWTDDDIHRNPDGSFRRGAELNPPSLMETRGNK